MRISTSLCWWEMRVCANPYHQITTPSHQKTSWRLLFVPEWLDMVRTERLVCDSNEHLCYLLKTVTLDRWESDLRNTHKHTLHTFQTHRWQLVAMWRTSCPKHEPTWYTRGQFMLNKWCGLLPHGWGFSADSPHCQESHTHTHTQTPLSSTETLKIKPGLLLKSTMLKAQRGSEGGKATRHNHNKWWWVVKNSK